MPRAFILTILLLIRRRLIMLLFIGVSLLAVAACTPQMQREAAAVPSAPVAESASNQVRSSGEAVTPPSLMELPTQLPPPSLSELPGQPPSPIELPDPAVPPSDPSERSVPPSGQAMPGPPALQAPFPLPTLDPPNLPPIPTGTMVDYTDSTYKFSVSHPSDFVVRSQPAEKLLQLMPMPDASFLFMNPVTAASELVDLQFAELEIRIYRTGKIASLDNWLTSNGLLPADGSMQLDPFQTANTSGFQVCASSAIAPSCSYFFTGNGWVYQLIPATAPAPPPATAQGEAMVQTFKLVP